jgi:thimet oligopeptidase
MIEPMQLPERSDAWREWLDNRITAELTAARTLMERLKDGAQRSTADVLDTWNDTDLALSNAESVAAAFSEIHPDPQVRALAEEREQEISRLITERGQDRELYRVFAATEDEPGDEGAARVRAKVLRDFRRSGIDRDDATRDRLRAVWERLTVLEQNFNRAIREDVRSVRLRPEQLDGMPQDYRDAHPVDVEGLVTITTDYPDAIPLRMYAHDAAARRALTMAMLDKGWPANDTVLAEILALRAEAADLLGYPSWPDYDAEVKMIGSAVAIGEFIDMTAKAADRAAREDYAALLARAQEDDPARSTLSRADSGYYEERIRRERFDVDAQQVRRYFDFGRVRAGLLDTTARLFGLEYHERADVPVWHEDVTAYDFVDDGAAIGRIYLDLHPRDGKFKHAAHFQLASGVKDKQLPEGALVCNFPRGLMEHSHVVTLFHEFGHLVHHVLAGRQRWERFSGVATEWDFVEAPSQMLEEWARDASVLRRFAVAEDGEPIPVELVERLRAGSEFGKALFVRAQLFYAAVSYRLHLDRPEDRTGAVRELQQQYDLFEYLEGTHFHAGFGHLAGYTSAYYTYLWSLVIAKDLFSAFDPGDLLASHAAYAYRDTVLAPGGSRDAAELVADFLGRPYTTDAFRRWLEEVPAGRR